RRCGSRPECPAAQSPSTPRRTTREFSRTHLAVAPDQVTPDPTGGVSLKCPSRPPVPVLRVMVAEMGQHLIERLPPGSVAPFGEVTARRPGTCKRVHPAGRAGVVPLPHLVRRGPAAEAAL